MNFVKKLLKVVALSEEKPTPTVPDVEPTPEPEIVEPVGPTVEEVVERMEYLRRRYPGTTSFVRRDADSVYFHCPYEIERSLKCAVSVITPNFYRNIASIQAVVTNGDFTLDASTPIEVLAILDTCEAAIEELSTLLDDRAFMLEALGAVRVEDWDNRRLTCIYQGRGELAQDQEIYRLGSRHLLYYHNEDFVVFVYVEGDKTFYVDMYRNLPLPNIVGGGDHIISLSFSGLGELKLWLAEMSLIEGL